MAVKFKSWKVVTTPLPRNKDGTIDFYVDDRFVYIRRGEESGFNEDEIVAVMTEAERHDIAEYSSAEEVLAFAAGVNGLVRTFKVRQGSITTNEVFAIPGVETLYTDLKDDLLISAGRREFAQWLSTMQHNSQPMLYLLNNPATNAAALEHISKVAIGGSAGSYR